MTDLAEAPVTVAGQGHDARTVVEWRAEIGHRFPVDPSLVIPVLQYVLAAAGYLPQSAVQATADHLRVPISRVLGVASFYSQFHFEPRGATTIQVCRGTACHVRGSGAILRELEEHLGIKAGGTTPDLLHSIETVACFGSCALAPVLVRNGRVHGRQTGSTAKAMVQASGSVEPAARPLDGPVGVASERAPAVLDRLVSLEHLDRRIEAARQTWSELHAGTEAVISVGTATCGLAAGAADVMEAAQRELTRLGIPARLVPVGCLGMCFAEPLVEIAAPGLPKVVYQGLSAATVGEVLRAHLVRRDPPAAHALGSAGDEIVPGIPRLADLPVLRSQVRLALRNCGVIDPSDVEHYLARDGYAGLRRALGMSPDEVIEEVRASGLRGRGGAGFPTAAKWEFCRAAGPRPSS